MTQPSGAPTRLVAPGVVEIDTLLGGWQQATAGYLCTGAAPVLVETGSQTSVPAVRRALFDLGIAPKDLAAIAVTHIHLDHADGVGDLAAAFPSATIYVHELGARHLVDPSRLIASAGRVYGDLLDTLYGRLAPTEAGRLKVLRDGEAIDLGGNRRLVALDSPGHAKHHLGFFDEGSGLLFAGDAVGVRLPEGGHLRPATPPPDFDLELARSSLSHFASHRPRAIALAHYGVVPGAPEELLAHAAEELTRWAEVAKAAWHAGEDIAEALAARFTLEVSNLSAAVREKVETLNGIHSNAAGLRRWLDQQQAVEQDRRTR